MSQPKLHIFKSGFIKTRKSLIIKDADDEDFVIPVLFFLIEHPRGRLLYDCGQPLTAVNDGKKPFPHQDYVPIMSVDDYAPNRLQKAGIEPASINYVVVSHLHSDHSGALGCFPNAVHFIQKAELEYGSNKLSVERCRLKLRVLDGAKFHDIFGDGSIKILFTPGHTPGHQSLLLGQTLLAGDSVYVSDILKGDALPGIAWDYDVEKATLGYLRRMISAGFQVIPGHEMPEYQR